MSKFSSRTARERSKNQRKLHQKAARRHYLEALEPRQFLSVVPVQTYYLPVPAASVLQALQTIHADPKGPVSTYVSIAVAEDNTQIFYDQWENGYVSDITAPSATEIYNSVTNPAGVQIWGDGDPSNGAAPGYPNDVLHAGDVILLDSPAITVPRDPSQIYYDGGDKIAATKSVAIGELNYAAGTATKLAGALRVNPTSAWGVSYKVPVGQNTAGRAAMFNYTGLSITAAKDGTTIQIDMDGNGKVDKTVTLNEGQSYLVNNGVKQGATVVSTDPSKPIQVDVITGTPSQTYASRWFTLAPIDQWSSSYFTPVSTRSANATVVFLYNPSSSAITVTHTMRGAAGTAATLTTGTIKVPAKGTAKVTIPEGSGAHFYTAGGQPFYAVSTTDFGGSNYDWGMSLIPEDQLTTQAIVGLGFGRDPTSTVNMTENGSPVWVTPTGNGDTAATVYVDFNGDDAGPFTDPNGYHYDEALSLKELQRAKIFDPDGDQSGMLIYTLDPNVKLAVSWGEDPSTASEAFPGIDAGTNVAPLPEYDAGKSASLLVDANGDGVVSPGDTLLYSIVVNNISRTTLADLALTDNLPADLTYVANSTSYTITPHDGTVSAPVAIPDSGSTAFPLDETGEMVPMLAGGATYTVTFQAKIPDILPDGVTDIINTGSVDSPALNEVVPLESDTPVQYDVRGLVFQDTNRNGAQDAGEPGMAGVQVNLLSGSTIAATAMTDATGHYLFTGVALGSYTVDVVDSSVQAVLPGAVQFAGVDPSPVTVTGGGAVTDAGSDGYMTVKVATLPSTLSGRVTLDGAGVGGVVITLTGTTDQGPITPVTFTTNPDGSYGFVGLLPGTYALSEAQPAGLLDGTDSAGSLGGTAAPIPGDQISGIVVTSGSSGVNYDFNELSPSSASGVVYADANNNGVRDAGEAPIGGVVMTLTGSNDLGPIAPITVTTAADGSYSFGMLRPGTYTITETQPAGYLDGKDAKGGVVIAGSSTTDVIGGITLGSGDSAANNTFGELLAGSTSGLVFVDGNNNGVKDAGEAPIGGVVLTLTGSNDLGAIAPITVTTAADGSYSFGTLRPGTYTITETEPAGYLDGKDAKGGVVIAGSSTTDVISGITLGSGGSAANNTFGELAPANSSGVVYVDSNNNGVKDAGEAPISGVVLTLTGSNDLGAIAPITVTTAADGSYSFGTLRPGTYTVTETQPAGYLDGKDAKGGVVIAGSNTTDVIGGITLGSGGSAANNTFGELAPANSSGVVYVDSNNNGMKDAGEAPIGGVVLTLTGSNDLGTIAPITVTTAADGSYSFGTLRPGTYTVTETQPAGYFDGKDAKGGVVIAGSNTTDVIGGITLGSGGSAANNTFGELLAGSASGFVYADANNNGIKDAGEAPISGVVMTLTGNNDLGVIAPITVTTAADGSYSFGNLRPGTYTITETPPANYFDGKETVGSLGGTLGNEMVSAIPVTSGAAGNQYNFGEVLGGISGQTYRDTTGNGASADDTLVGGVTVNLYRDDGDHVRDAGDVLVASTVSAAGTGAYSFGNLPKGYYFAEEVVPTGWVRTGPTNVDYYANDLSGTTSGITGDNFTNYQICGCKNNASCVYYVINGCTTVNTLAGNVHQGDTVKVVFTLNTTGTFSLVSYTAPDSTFIEDHSSQQVIFDSNTGTFSAGTHSLTVVIPNSYYQIDFVCGTPLNILGPSGSNIYYTPEGRLIGSDNGGTTPPTALVTPNGTGSIAGSVYIDSNNNGYRNSGETGIAGVKITLTGITATGDKVKVSVMTDASGNYKFYSLKPGTYKISEGSLEGHHDGKDSAGTSGGAVANDVISNVILGNGINATGYLFGET